jgi:hypothetical protein
MTWNWVTKQEASKWKEGIPVICFIPENEHRSSRYEMQSYFRPDWIWTWVDDALFCEIEPPKLEGK